MSSMQTHSHAKVQSHSHTIKYSPYTRAWPHSYTKIYPIPQLLCTRSLEGGGEGDDCVHLRVVEIWQSEECLGYHPSLCGWEGRGGKGRGGEGRGGEGRGGEGRGGEGRGGEGRGGEDSERGSSRREECQGPAAYHGVCNDCHREPRMFHMSVEREDMVDTSCYKRWRERTRKNTSY